MLASGLNMAMSSLRNVTRDSRPYSDCAMLKRWCYTKRVTAGYTVPNQPINVTAQICATGSLALPFKDADGETHRGSISFTSTNRAVEILSISLLPPTPQSPETSMPSLHLPFPISMLHRCYSIELDQCSNDDAEAWLEQLLRFVRFRKARDLPRLRCSTEHVPRAQFLICWLKWARVKGHRQPYDSWVLYSLLEMHTEDYGSLFLRPVSDDGFMTIWRPREVSRRLREV